MRAVKKGAVFADIEEADAMLRQLHGEFPETTIPGPNKLLVMIYVRENLKPSEKPIQKWKFKIEALHEGGFKISYEPNIYKPRIKVGEESSTPVNSEKTQTGYFTSLMALRKNKKK
jgi:hypothetical protein